MEPPNNGHGGDEHFVHCSEVVPSLEVEMYGQLMAGGKQFFFHCREVVLLLECPLSEVLLYTKMIGLSMMHCHTGVVLHILMPCIVLYKPLMIAVFRLSHPIQ